MKYKIGDRVRVQSLDWYNQNKNKLGSVPLGQFSFNCCNTHLCGAILTIKKVLHGYYLVEENSAYWTDEMIEGIVEEETKSKSKPKFKVGDRVRLKGRTDIGGTITDIKRGQLIIDTGLSKRVEWSENVCLIESVEEETKPFTYDETVEIIETMQGIGDSWECPQGYQFVDENGNVINATKIVLEKKHNDKLKLESTKTVREYWSEYARIYIEIYEDEPNECVLTHLYTLEGHRQKGYGRQALIEAESIAKELGCHTTYLKVETDSWMHQWYLRMGYKWYKNVNKEYTWLTKNL